MVRFDTLEDILAVTLGSFFCGLIFYIFVLFFWNLLDFFLRSGIGCILYIIMFILLFINIISLFDSNKRNKYSFCSLILILSSIFLFVNTQTQFIDLGSLNKLMGVGLSIFFIILGFFCLVFSAPSDEEEKKEDFYGIPKYRYEKNTQNVINSLLDLDDESFNELTDIYCINESNKNDNIKELLSLMNDEELVLAINYLNKKQRKCPNCETVVEMDICPSCNKNLKEYNLNKLPIPNILITKTEKRDYYYCRRCHEKTLNMGEYKNYVKFIKLPSYGGNIEINNLFALCESCFEKESKYERNDFTINIEKLEYKINELLLEKSCITNTSKPKNEKEEIEKQYEFKRIEEQIDELTKELNKLISKRKKERDQKILKEQETDKEFLFKKLYVQLTDNEIGVLKSYEELYDLSKEDIIKFYVDKYGNSTEIINIISKNK